MKVIVAIKQVPSRDSSVRVASGGTWIDTSDSTFEINEPDAYALETGLILKERHGGEVVALCAGPARCLSTVREALAKGADRAIHVDCEHLEALDTLGVAHLLADAIRDEHADLLLTGLQSDDLGLGQTGVVLAEILDIPHATIVMEVAIEGSSLRVKRELEDGWFQWIEMPMPALLTIQSGISKLRYATLMGIKKAKTKGVRTVTPAHASESSVHLDRVYLPKKNKETRLIPGNPQEAAAELLTILRTEVRVL